MQLISTELIKSINGGAPENAPAQSSMTIVGGGNASFAYGHFEATIPITPNIDLQPYVNGNTVTGVNEYGMKVTVYY